MQKLLQIYVKLLLLNGFANLWKLLLFDLQNFYQSEDIIIQ